MSSSVSTPWLGRSAATSVWKKVIGGAGTAGAIHACSVVAHLGSNVLLARWMTVEQFGVYGHLVSQAAMVAVFAGFGMPLAVMRFVPRYLVRGEIRLLRGMLGTLEKAILIASAVLAAVLWGVAMLWLDLQAEGDWRAYGAAMFLMVVVAFGLYQAELARAFQQLVLAYGPMRVLWPLLVATLPPVFLVLGISLAARNILVASAAVLLGTLLWQRQMLWRSFAEKLKQVSPLYDYGQWSRVAFPLWVVAGGSAVLANLDVVAVGIYRKPHEAGVYFAAKRLSAMIVFAHFSVVSYVAPQVSTMFHQGNKHQLRRTLRLSAVASVSGAAICTAIVCLWGDRLLDLFGGDFVAGSRVLTVLAIGQFASSVVGADGPLLNVSGREVASAVIAGGATLLLGGLLFSFTPRFGLMGAACAMTTVSAVRAIPIFFLARHIVNRMTGFEPN